MKPATLDGPYVFTSENTMRTVSPLASMSHQAAFSDRRDAASQQRRMADAESACDAQQDAPGATYNPVRGVLFGLVLSLPLWLVILWLV